MELDQILAANLKRIREQRALSLSQLAEYTGLSKVMLSQLERGGSNPTINNIWKIANALGVPYTALLDAQENTAAVIHGSELVPQISEDGQCKLFCYYTSSAERNFEWFRMLLAPGAEYVSEGHKNKAHEYVIMTSGEIEIETMGVRYRLYKGDAFHFYAANRHSYFSLGTEPAEASIINYSPI